MYVRGCVGDEQPLNLSFVLRLNWEQIFLFDRVAIFNLITTANVCFALVLNEKLFADKVLLRVIRG